MSAPQAPVGHAQAKPANLTLQADFAAPTGPQGAAIADALRLLAAWAVRTARQGHGSAPGANQAAEAGLDFPRPSSDECEAIPGHDER